MLSQISISPSPNILASPLLFPVNISNKRRFHSCIYHHMFFFFGNEAIPPMAYSQTVALTIRKISM